MEPRAIVTIPPYAPFIREVSRHPIVSGLRLNTVMPVKDPLEDVLKRIVEDASGKDVWVDLKARQLRVEGYWVPPYTTVALSHPISVECPTTAYFSDGKEYATVLGVDGNKLILQEGPQRVIGPGEAVNIPHHSLRIEGNLTDTDKAYIAAARSIGLHNYMLSFVESEDDIKALKDIDAEADIVAKIESRKGLDYVRSGNPSSRLMAARGDLYVEVGRPHEIVRAVEDIIKADPNAMVASRIFPSLSHGYEPSCQDIGDVAHLLGAGYRTFMFGDDICMRRDSIMSGLNLLQAMSESYKAH